MTTYLNPSTRSGGIEQIVVPERQSAVPVDDAPFDDEQYVRVNGEWVPAVAPPIIPDTLAPKPPSGLAAAGTMAGNGSSVDYELSWNAPTLNVDDSPLTDFAYYVVRWRYVGAGAYQAFTTKETTFQLPGLVPGKNIEWSVLARDFSGNDSTWADALLTGLADTTPPNKPNPPAVSSRLGALIVGWDGTLTGGAPPADFDHLEVYASATTGGPWEPVGRLAGAGMVVAAGIPVGETRYVTTVAVDTSGNASTRSDESSIVIIGVTGPDIAANAVTANSIEAGAVGAQQLSSIIAIISKLCSSETGRRWEADEYGIRLYDVDETLIINFPTDPNGVASIAGDFVATSLTVTDQLAIRGLVNEISKGAQVTLSSGTSAPSSPPAVAIEWDTVSTVRDATYDPYRVGLAWDSNSARWILGQNYSGGGFSFAEYLNDGYSNTFGVGYLWGEEVDNVTSVTVLNGIAYALGVDDPNSYVQASDGFYYVEGWRLSDGVRVSRWKYPHVFGTSGTAHRKPFISNDGTNLVIAFTNYSSNFVQWRKFNPSTGALVGSTVTSNLAVPKDFSAFIITNADFGVPRYIVVPSGEATAKAMDAAGAAQANDDFPLPSTNVTGLGWDPSNNRFVSHDPNAARFHFHTGINWTTQSSTWWVSTTWHDPDATGGTHETAQGPRKSFTMKKRSSLRISPPPLPVRPVPNTTNDVTTSRIFIGRGASDPGRTYMENVATTSATSYVLSAMTFPTGVAVTPPPAISDFPASSPAKIVSAGGNIVLNGDGTGSAGAITFGASATSDTTIAGRLSVNGRYIPAVATGQTASLPSVASGGFHSLTVSFPAGRFTAAPKVTVSASSGRLNAAARAVTSTSFTLEVFNCSAAATGTAETAQWQAIQE